MTDKTGAKAEDDGRKPPKRKMSRQEGLRQIMHAAIRMYLAGEDPFAINMLGQATEKVLTGILKHKGIDDPFPLDDWIVPERKAEFFRIYREPFNFFKHADRDPEAELNVYEFTRSNEILIFVNILRYKKLYSVVTEHMSFFWGLVSVLSPGLIKWDKFGDIGQTFLRDRKNYEDLSRAECISHAREMIDQNGKFLAERSHDLRDVHEYNRKLLSGKPAPYTFKIPIPKF